MSKENIYIDWSKAPEGTNHAFVYDPSDWCNGLPAYGTLWEKWEDDVIYEWSGVAWIYCNMATEVNHCNRIKKPEEKVMSANSLEQNIERMEKELSEMKVKLKAGEKWQPKGGDWFVDFNGKVKNYRSINLECSWFGTSFQTQQQAEIASRLMRQHNRIVQYVLQYVPDWKFQFKFGDYNYMVEQEEDGRWVVEHYLWSQPIGIPLPSWVAPHLANDLNSGRVEL